MSIILCLLCILFRRSWQKQNNPLDHQAHNTLDHKAQLSWHGFVQMLIVTQDDNVAESTANLATKSLYAESNSPSLLQPKEEFVKWFMIFMTVRTTGSRVCSHKGSSFKMINVSQPPNEKLNCFIKWMQWGGVSVLDEKILKNWLVDWLTVNVWEDWVVTLKMYGRQTVWANKKVCIFWIELISSRSSTKYYRHGYVLLCYSFLVNRSGRSVRY